MIETGLFLLDLCRVLNVIVVLCGSKIPEAFKGEKRNVDEHENQWAIRFGRRFQFGVCNWMLHDIVKCWQERRLHCDELATFSLRQSGPKRGRNMGGETLNTEKGEFHFFFPSLLDFFSSFFFSFPPSVSVPPPPFPQNIFPPKQTLHKH
jgi:hypothetical protein